MIQDEREVLDSVEALTRMQTEIDERRAENGRLLVELTHRVGWEERCIRAEAENEGLKAELARWKPAHCGKIYPVPIPGEAVEYCVRDPDHDGPHQAQTGKVWVFPHNT